MAAGMNTHAAPLPSRWQDRVLIDRLLRECRRLAIVGLSGDPLKASNFVGRYMQHEGYQILPVSPRGGLLLGEPVRGSLAQVPPPIDMVVVFRPAADCPEVARQAVAAGARALWIQLGIVSEEAAQLAAAAGLEVVMDKCVKMEHGRLKGSLHFAGMDTGLISARKRGR